MHNKANRHIASTHAAIVVTVLVTTGTLGGCVTNSAKHDFYAMRSVRLGSVQGDSTVIVRADRTDMLTRERRAMALGSAD